MSLLLLFTGGEGAQIVEADGASSGVADAVVVGAAIWLAVSASAALAVSDVHGAALWSSLAEVSALADSAVIGAMVTSVVGQSAGASECLGYTLISVLLAQVILISGDDWD